MRKHRGHRAKVRMARKMMTREEIKNHVSPFQSKAWEARKHNIAIGLENLKVAASWHKQAKNYDNQTIETVR